MKLITEGKNYDSLSNEAKDLILHADDEPGLKNARKTIVANLAAKKAQGKYDLDDALGLWKYHADRAAMSCCGKHGDGSKAWHKMFPGKTRAEAAGYLEALHKDNLEH